MKIIKYILALLLILQASSGLWSQSDSIFLNAGWNITENRASAKYFREIQNTENDSILLVHDYYLENGGIQMIGTYRGSMKRSNQYGEFKYYFINGNLKAIYEYQGGLVSGYLKRYYENGNIKSIEKFDLGSPIDTIFTYHENGAPFKTELINLKYSSENPADLYTKRKLISAYTEDGSAMVENGTGEFIQYFLSGKKRTSIEYENGVPHGKMIKYTGQKNKVSSVLTFKEGRFIKGELYDNGKKDIFGTLSRKAHFPTGIRGLDKFISMSIGNCESIEDADLLVMLTITQEGNVFFEQVVSGTVSPCQLEEIQMMVKNMPIWIPAIENGKYIEANQAIKIKYQ